RRTHERSPHAHRGCWLARFDPGANRRCRPACAQEPGAKSEGPGQEAFGGWEVEEAGVARRSEAGGRRSAVGGYRGRPLGLRRQSEAATALWRARAESNLPKLWFHSKAVSPLRSATAVQDSLGSLC